GGGRRGPVPLRHREGLRPRSRDRRSAPGVEVRRQERGLSAVQSRQLNSPQPNVQTLLARKVSTFVELPDVGCYPPIPAHMLWSNRERPQGGPGLSWILLAALGIIWATFLIPSRRHSPRSSVEEFERKMTILADANNWSSAGRWVLMPQRGQRFMGSRDRSRARVRRRRRQVFTVLVEATGVTFLIGLVPRLRPMLYGTAILVGLLVVYSLMLLTIPGD